MTPKSLLRHPLVSSDWDTLLSGQFALILPEVDKLPAKKVKRVILCAGKVYYGLLAARRAEKIDTIAIVRIEQLYPFPEAALSAVLKQYAGVHDIVWCQEEPKNQGAWYQLYHRISTCLRGKQTLRYVGREASAAPASGYLRVHKEQQARFIATALLPTATRAAGGSQYRKRK